jgi:phage tail sheath protein FI
MAVYQRPGVYVSETLTPTPPSAGVATNVAAAFLGAVNQGPATPTLVTSWSQFTQLYGSWAYDTTDTFRLAVYSFLVLGAGGQCYIQRVAASGASTASRLFLDSSGTGNTIGTANTMAINALSSGAWGNNIYVDVVKQSATTSRFSLVVYYGSSAINSVVERWNDLCMDVTDPRYAPQVINGVSQWITLTDESDTASEPGKSPFAVAGVQLAGGANGSGGQTATAVSTAVTGFNTVNQSLLINAPGITDSTSVNTLLSYAVGRADCFVIIDPGYQDVSDELTLSAAYTQTSYGAAYYPNITIADPTTNAPGATKSIAPGGAVAAAYVKTDSSRGVFKAPAGLQTRLGGVVNVAPIVSADLDSLNSGGAAGVPVNAIRFINGAGIVIMGARTLQQGYVTMYIPIRRTLIYLEKALNDLTKFALFEPNDGTLWRTINATVSNFLNSFWRQGGLRGTTPQQAFYVVCDSTNNNVSSIDAGIVNISVGVALQRPAEFVVINIAQYDGGTVITSA